ncbi:MULTISPECIES: phosphotransferase [unclassified Virgibacillus]|uniref:phosphotransferase n=1 Tax=unclassified Virgibacillus TaxID=2620237 RepID=UPI0024DEA05D|nr:phosphotransferase [Virgibacillus sp. LDC-1]
MSNRYKGEEMTHHRLSSFLLSEGGLSVQYVRKIKQHVFHIETVNEKEYIVKAHANKKNVMQQWDFFRQVSNPHIVPFIFFPNGKRTISLQPFTWTLSPFIRGKKLRYAKASDRQEALETVQKFHAQASGIFIEKRLKRRLLFERWYDRLLSFQKTAHLFAENGYTALYKDIVITAEHFFKKNMRFPWKTMQQEAEQKGQWIHGDVASHNFIHTRKTTCLIDYDLLQASPHIFDFIQLGQRFLPFLNWDLSALISYHMVDEEAIPKWLCAIAIPSDVMREWMYFLPEATDDKLKTYLEEMEQDWEARKNFFRKTEKMVKSM